MTIAQAIKSKFKKTYLLHFSAFSVQKGRSYRPSSVIFISLCNPMNLFVRRVCGARERTTWVFFCPLFSKRDTVSISCYLSGQTDGLVRPAGLQCAEVITQGFLLPAFFLKEALFPSHVISAGKPTDLFVRRVCGARERTTWVFFCLLFFFPKEKYG